MKPAMELVHHAEPPRERSPFAAARVHRQLTVEEAARRAGLAADQVTWLEEGRVYRFPSSDDAIMAALLYATALGIDHREARALAGLPVPPLPPEANRVGRLAVVGGLALTLLLLVVLVLIPGVRGPSTDRPSVAQPRLPPPWKVDVDILNGNGDINYTRRVASHVGALAYRVQRVTRADRFDYPTTAVYYEPGGQALAIRLARQLGVATRPLPGGNDPNRLVVIVGPERGPGE